MKAASTPVLTKIDAVIKQVVGQIGWKDYLRLKVFCAITKQKQKDVVVLAINEFLDRQEEK